MVHSYDKYGHVDNGTYSGLARINKSLGYFMGMALDQVPLSIIQ